MRVIEKRELLKGIQLLSCTIVYCCASTVFGQSAQYLLEDEFITGLMEKENIPGFAIGIVGNSEAAGIRTYGLASANSNAPVNSETIFELASTSKPIFALTIMQLIENGVLELDKPLYEYLELESIADDERRKKITARMVLNHTSGLPNALPRGESPSIMFEPGTKYSYSGWGFRYLQYVVEELTGETLSQLVGQFVFNPLGMTKASYLWSEEYGAISADGHSADGLFSREIVKLTSEYAEGGIITDITELTRFVEFVLKEHQGKSKMLLSMINPDVLVHDFGDSGSISRGLGWAIEETPLGISLWHGGSNGAFKAFIFIDLEKEAGLAILSNSANGNSFVPQLVSKLFGEHHLMEEYFLLRKF